MCSATHYFNLRAVSQLLNSVAVLCVELQQNGHLEGGCLKRKTNINICIVYEYILSFLTKLEQDCKTKLHLIK